MITIVNMTTSNVSIIVINITIRLPQGHVLRPAAASLHALLLAPPIPSRTPREQILMRGRDVVVQKTHARHAASMERRRTLWNGHVWIEWCDADTTELRTTYTCICKRIVCKLKLCTVIQCWC